MLTGGVLLLRNKYYIVIFRGKDFLPQSVAAALAERQEVTKQIQDVEERVRSNSVEAAPSGEDKGKALAGTLAEFYEAQARWGRDISTEEREKMIEEASKAKTARLVKRTEHKLAIVSMISYFTQSDFKKTLLKPHMLEACFLPVCSPCLIQEKFHSNHF